MGGGIGPLIGPPAHILVRGFYPGEQDGRMHAERVGDTEQLVDADVADAVLYLGQIALVDIGHECQLRLGDVLPFSRLCDALSQLSSFLEIIHSKKAIEAVLHPFQYRRTERKKTVIRLSGELMEDLRFRLYSQSSVSSA